MISKEWLDCRFQADDTTAVIENDVLRIRWSIGEYGLSLAGIENKTTGFCWCAADGTAAAAPRCMALADAQPVWQVRTEQDLLSDEHWVIEFLLQNGTQSICRRMTLFPHCPFLTLSTEWNGISADAFSETVRADEAPEGIERDPSCTEDSARCVPGDIMAMIPLPRTHLRWEALRFYDQTDVHDTLISRSAAPFYPVERVDACGSIFQVHAQLEGETLFTARHAPVTPLTGIQFSMLRETLSILQNGCAGPLPDSAESCSCVIGAVRTQDAARAYRDFYRRAWRAPWQEHALMLSNTWGDRNRDARICESFLKQEIDCAAALGLDAMQIDDGWQSGITVNSAHPVNGVWEGYYSASEDFWQPRAERFPNGLVSVSSYAEKNGLALGLWFSPDSSNEFANWHRDAETILHLYHAYHASIIKLDGVKLRTPLARRRFVSMMQEVLQKSEGKVLFQQDITAEQRLGYFANRQYGMLYVENRYTDFRSYYPHRTLRNIWMLSQYIPTQRLLFELLNPRRCIGNYQNDPFAPNEYSADYLFAVTMTAQPLFFMELSGLSEADIQSLQKIIAVYRAHRDAMWHCDVKPIGSEPDGTSLTGFLLTDTENSSEGFLLAFRENTAQDTVVFDDMPRGMRLRILCSNSNVRRLPTESGRLALRFDAERSYVLMRWTAPRS